MCFSSMGLSIAKQYIPCEQRKDFLDIWKFESKIYMKILKENSYDQKKLKEQITQKYGKGLSKLFLQVIFSNH
jgi:hypothetical protein